MANPVLMKRSSVAGKVPALTDIQLGELAINTTDGYLFLKKNVAGVDSIVQVGAVSSVAGRSGDVALTKTDVGLGNIDNTADLSKPVSSAQQAALNLKANLASPSFTGSPLAPTAAAGTNNTQLATTAFVAAAVAVVAASSAAVSSVAGRTGAIVLTSADVGLLNVDNTSDANKPVSTAQLAALNLKANLASPTFTGTPAGPTATVGTNTTQLATTAFVTAAIAGGSVTSVAGRAGAVVLAKADVGLSNIDNTADADKPVSTAQQTALNLKANLASPTFTGVPVAPTATAGTNTTQIATTAFVAAAVAGGGAVTSVAGRTGVIVLTKSDVGLSNVDNTSDLSKPVSTATAAADTATLTSAKSYADGLVTGMTTLTGTQTLTNKTLDNATFINGYTEESQVANTSTAFTLDLANGTIFYLTLTGNCTFTFPAVALGKSFTLWLTQDATGGRTVTWPATVAHPGGVVPTITTTAGKSDKFVFQAAGTKWTLAAAGQNYTL
jgi:hypothetical protein